MARQSIVLLPSTGQQVNVVGQPVKAAGYYGSGLNLHTFAVYLNDFSGRLYIDGTLANEPCENDWFEINLQGYLPYLEYAYNPTNPYQKTGVTYVDNFSFDGNFTYLRARIDRRYLTDVYPLHSDFGEISKILLNY